MKAKFLPALLLALLLSGAPVGAAAATDAPADASADAPAADAATSWIAERTEDALAAVAGQIDALHDNYAYYYTQRGYQLTIDDYHGSFGGIGISMINNDDHDVEIYNILAGYPAAESEIAIGDIILSCGETDLRGMDISMAASHLRGEIGTPVTVMLQHADGTVYTVTLTRQLITETSVEGEPIEESPGVGYIHISDFSSLTVSQFADVFNTMHHEQPIGCLIIDLRSNGGGNYFAAIQIANFFIEPGTTVVTEKTAAGRQDYNSIDGTLAGMPLYILVNRYTASASEVLAGALHDSAGAVLIGEQTYGKGITLAVLHLDSGCGLRYTRSHYFLPSGFDLQAVGITPDEPVAIPEDMTYARYFSTDPAENPDLAAALRLIEKR